MDLVEDDKNLYYFLRAGSSDDQFMNRNYAI